MCLIKPKHNSVTSKISLFMTWNNYIKKNKEEIVQKNRPKVQKVKIYFGSKNGQKHFLSANNKEESDEELLLKFIASETADQARVFHAISKEKEAFLAEQSKDKGETDGIFDFLSTLSDLVQNEIDDLLSSDSGKKDLLRHCGEYPRYYLTQKSTLPKKKKRIIKIAIEITLKIWQEPRQQ